MLALSIKPGQFVTIGPDIKICNNQQETIRIAIDAPRDLKIERSDMKKTAPTR